MFTLVWHRYAAKSSQATSLQSIAVVQWISRCLYTNQQRPVKPEKVDPLQVKFTCLQMKFIQTFELTWFFRATNNAMDFLTNLLKSPDMTR
jgi:hypothetical protein